MLTFRILLVSVNLWSSMPNTSGVNAIGIWMMACIVMVFGALTEYGIILYIMFNTQRSAQITNYNGKHCNCKKEDDDSKSGTTINGRTENEKEFVISQNTAGYQKESGVNSNEENKQFNSYGVMKDIALQKIDSVSLFMVPTVFILFTVVYIALFQK